MYVCLAALLCQGCGYYLARTGALPDYGRLRDVESRGAPEGCARAYAALGWLFLDYDVLYVKPVKPWGDAAQASPRMSHYCAFLRERTLNGLYKLHKFRIISTTPEFLDRRRYKLNAVVLEMFITRLDEGSALLRYVIGADLGAADAQIEGRLYDAQTGDSLMEFAFRRRHADNPLFGLNVTVLNSRKQVEEVLIQHAYAVVELVRKHP